MPFDSGTVSFQVCELPQAMPEDALERFAAKAAGPLEHVKAEPRWGWVSGRHLLESRIDDETAYAGGHIHLCLRHAQRKIPTSLLRAECRMAELSLQAEQGIERLSRKQRRRIKQEVSERLLPNMPPQLKGVPFVIDASCNKLYVSATSDKQIDSFLASFYQTVGFEPVPLTAEVLTAKAGDVDLSSIPLLNFSEELPDGAAGGTVGENFLTWLWFFLEQRGGVLPKTQLGEFSMMIDGPLVLVADGPGALESSIRKGLPTISAEAKAALLVGKKLRRAKLILARSREEQWTATVDASNFAFRSVRLPEGEALDPGSIFQERVMNIYTLHTVFTELFRKFVTDVSDPQKASTIQKEAQQWVKEMDGK